MGFGWDLPPGCSPNDIDGLFEDETPVTVVATDDQMAVLTLLVPILPSGDEFEFLDDEDLP